MLATRKSPVRPACRVTVAVAIALLAGLGTMACQRPGEWDTSGVTTTTIVPSPFPQNYSWALMTLDGALAGEGSVQQPQRDTGAINGRYTAGGILIDFGHGQGSLRVELRPLDGTGRYIVDKDRGYVHLKLGGRQWDSRESSICSFNFWRVTGSQVPLVPPPGGEVFEVDLGFVCAGLKAVGGGPDLNIIDGRIHTFLVRPASEPPPPNKSSSGNED